MASPFCHDHPEPPGPRDPCLRVSAGMPIHLAGVTSSRGAGAQYKHLPVAGPPWAARRVARAWRPLAHQVWLPALGPGLARDLPTVPLCSGRPRRSRVFSSHGNLPSSSLALLACAFCLGHTVPTVCSVHTVQCSSPSCPSPLPMSLPTPLGLLVVGTTAVLCSEASVHSPKCARPRCHPNTPTCPEPRSSSCCVPDNSTTWRGTQMAHSVGPGPLL